MNDCYQITDAIVPYLIYYCPNLVRLGLRNTKLSSIALTGILEKFDLTEINLNGLPVVMDSHLYQISKKGKVTNLDISFCFQVSVDGVRRVLECAFGLKELYLFGIGMQEGDLGAFKRDGLTLFT
eukprot:TRINITY_DN1858_c0_g1_i5.p1 TRINITY_DN1858_c0_g1~~TRINITY_DN1858_c0_g1_i5.p1  ORF type:complete len:125 (-),score=26.86 TRINITY_DN1858_c0_g1_i5:129-503(-)